MAPFMGLMLIVSITSLTVSIPRVLLALKRKKSKFEQFKWVLIICAIVVFPHPLGPVIRNVCGGSFSFGSSLDRNSFTKTSFPTISSSFAGRNVVCNGIWFSFNRQYRFRLLPCSSPHLAQHQIPICFRTSLVPEAIQDNCWEHLQSPNLCICQNAVRFFRNRLFLLFSLPILYRCW